MTNWRSDGRQLYATRDGLEVSAEVPIRGQYTDARAWMRLLRISVRMVEDEVLHLENKSYKNCL
jgi:hypothetical protein